MITWVCERCYTPLEGNPVICPYCWYTVFRPTPTEKIARQERTMGKQTHHYTALDARVTAWLLSKGINPDMVHSDYSVSRQGGTTKLNITLYADDFMVDPEGTAADIGG